jgi:cytidylate kinase
MKRLILICGPNGVGKTTACRQLLEVMNHSAYVDSDWCRAMNPFAFDEETIGIIEANITGLMANYFQSSFIEDVIFQYGLHGPRKRILDDIMDELRSRGIAFRFCPVILTCDLEENIQRMKGDGRDDARIRRAVENTRGIYAAYDYPTIDTTALSVSETVDAIIGVLTQYYGHDGGCMARGS